MTILHGFDGVVVFAVLVIVGIHHLGDLLYRLLHWPRWLVRHYEKQRETEVAAALRGLGFGVTVGEHYRLTEIREKIAAAGRHADYHDRCIQLLKPGVIRQAVEVGKDYQVRSDYFVDVMSMSLEAGFSDAASEILASVLSDPLQRVKPFDRIAGIKGGSPLLAFKLAQRLNVPRCLFRGRDDYKYNSAQREPLTLFDGVIQASEAVLIVDDSTTGGRKVLDCIDAIRECNATVAGCVVLFEPVVKNVRRKLRDANVDLYSAIKLDDETSERLLK